MGNVVRVVEMARVGRERERERERVGAERERERVGAAEQAGGAGGEASAPRAGRRRRAEASGDSQADQTGATGANGAGNGGGAAASREVQVQVPTSAAATDALLNAGLEGFSTAGAALGAERYVCSCFSTIVFPSGASFLHNPFSSPTRPYSSCAPMIPFFDLRPRPPCCPHHPPSLSLVLHLVLKHSHKLHHTDTDPKYTVSSYTRPHGCSAGKRRCGIARLGG